MGGGLLLFCRVFLRISTRDDGAVEVVLGVARMFHWHTMLIQEAIDWLLYVPQIRGQIIFLLLQLHPFFILVRHLLAIVFFVHSYLVCWRPQTVVVCQNIRNFTFSLLNHCLRYATARIVFSAQSLQAFASGWLIWWLKILRKARSANSPL